MICEQYLLNEIILSGVIGFVTEQMFIFDINAINGLSFAYIITTVKVVLQVLGTFTDICE